MFMPSSRQLPPDRIDPMAGRRPWIRLDGATIAERPDRAGAFQVRITGHNLKMAISPPRILIGGVELTSLSFDPEGKAITGTLSKKPESDQVTVDYGFATGETTVSWSDNGK
jgi:hypothetical protein